MNRRTRVWLPPVLALGAVAIVGCNFIVGAGDYAVGGDSGTQLLTPEGGGDVTVPLDDSGADSAADGPRDGGRDAGRDAHVQDAGVSGRLGDPCITNAQCTAGTCDGLECTQPCTTNASCGMNSLGQPNYCVKNANGELVCVPGCTTDADCRPFASATCQPVTGVGESVCAAAPNAGDAGSSILIGDPCTTTNAPCGQNGQGQCNGSWCTEPCSADAGATACGSNSLGGTNFCVLNGNNVDICFPGCSTNADCTPFAGTTCQPIGGGTTGSICAATNGNIGDPCSTAANSPWTACAQGTCMGAWCNESCSSGTDTKCGTNSAGVTNHCVQNSSNAFSCFPGCTTANDCAPYANTFCQFNRSGPGFLCAVSSGQVGDPCNSDADCTQAGVTCAGNWCSKSCSSATDTSCGTNGSGGSNYCVQDSTSLNFECFPGCTTDMDCTPYAGATCVPTGTASQSVCSF